MVAVEANTISVNILGPKLAAPGTLVILDASKSDADSFIWRLADNDASAYALSENGKTVYFASPKSGRYVFSLAVAKRDGDKPPLLLLAEHVVTLQGESPKPDNPLPPPLPPSPSPDDPLANEKYGVGKLVRDLVLKEIPKEKRGTSLGFSANYNLVSSKLTNGSLSGLTSALSDLKARNQKTDGDDLGLWKSKVLDPLGSRLTDLARAGTINISDNSVLAQVFYDISLGLATAAN